MLTDELKYFPYVDMYKMACKVDEKNRKVTFLYKFKKGVCYKSYGLDVAALAGIPIDVVHRATEVAKNFEDVLNLAKIAE